MTYLNRLIRSVTPFVFIGLVSCVSKSPKSPQKLVERKVSKNPQTSGTILPKPGEKVAQPIANQAGMGSMMLYNKLIQGNRSLGEGDSALLEQIFLKPQKSQVEAAICFLAIIEELAPAGSEGTAMSLEEAALKVEIDARANLQMNPFLQSITVADRLINFLKVSQDSTEYRMSLLNAIKGKSQSWIQLWNTVASDQDIATPSPATPVVTGVVSQGEAVVDPSNYQSADLRLGDTILLRAQKLAEKGDFKKAIGQANKVQNRDPFFPEAQEKIKRFSNLAVQDLRQKAAQAFQSSLPVDDVETKMAYLEEAKRYLEEALSDYPAADHLRTVQENLSVITRDLTSIKEQNQY